MSFVDLATLALHRRHELEARINVFLEKCDSAIHDIEKLKSQASGFVDCLNCDPSELKEHFLNAMRQLDEYTYLLTDFNLAVCKLDSRNNIQHVPPVQDPTPRPIMTPIFNDNYNLMDALSEPAPSTSKACANMCPAEKEKRQKVPREERLLIAFSSASCSSESVPLPYNDTQEKQVQCQIDGLRNLNLDDSACADDLNLPAQAVLQLDQDYPALIMHTDGLTLWVITDWEEMFDFLIDMTNYYLENAVELKMEEVLSLTHCAYYDDDSKCYYRALIIRLTEEDVNMAEVFLVDTGEVRCTPVSTIQRLQPRFTRTAPFARCCHLAGIDLSHESKEPTEQLVALIKEHIGKRYSIRIDDNSSESLGVYVVLPSGETLNDMVLHAGLAPPIDRAGSSRRVRRNSELDDRHFDVSQCPEYDDPVEAVTGYRSRDEMDICMHYKGGPEKTCFKGARCKKRHVLMHPNGWTLDRVSVPARVPTLPLPAPGSWLRVYVSHVAYYDKLYVQLVDDNKPEMTPPTFGVVLPPITLEQLVRDMNCPASRVAYKPLTIAPAEGELVAALYPPDEQWYRARVLCATAADQNVEVLYIDYGNIVWVKEDAVRRLEPRWCSLPEQAVRCTLAGVTVDIATPAAHAAARDAFVALAKDRKLDARVVSREYNEMSVELYDAQGYSIAEQLLTSPHVKPREYAILDDTCVKQKIIVP